MVIQRLNGLLRLINYRHQIYQFPRIKEEEETNSSADNVEDKVSHRQDVSCHLWDKQR